jgi:lycopene beta-cyclase
MQAVQSRAARAIIRGDRWRGHPLTYGHFLLVFLVGPLCVLALLLRRRQSRRYLAATAAMATIAVVYTTLWDNYIVALSVWTYDPARIWGIVLGVVPLEEYLFFVLQTILTAQVLLGIAPHLGRRAQESCPEQRRKPGGADSLVLHWIPFVVGGAATPTGPFTYLVLETGWALPVIALQWILGHEVLRARWRALVAAVTVPSVYLTLADALAIHEGVWTINPALTLGVAPAGIVLEEALFFCLTNVMLVQGLLLAMEPAGALGRVQRWWRLARAR